MTAKADSPRVAVPEAGAGTDWRGIAVLRRLLLTLLVAGQTLTGTYFLAAVLPYHGGNALEISILAVFGLLFMWISVGFWLGAYGFVIRRFGGDRLSLCRRYRDEALANVPLARTAIVMPVCHESIARSFGGLRAVYRSLQRSGHLDHFDFFILSDSRDPQVWLAEQEAWADLVHELDADGRLFYRRRTLNLNYKSGNIADFLRRWGRRYEYAVVLDADSLMGGETLVKMVRLMQVEPRIGILQTAPRIVNGRSLFARVQQFSNQLYGPMYSTGLAALQLGEAAYWGHNAILRVEPFMRHCGLRRLRGFGLFRGPISSHDFVEGAYMGRAGYEVWLEPALEQSYEESPPSLVDELSRDRRWTKGNLQHIWLMLFARRLRLAHRIAFLTGVMSYLASPLWFAFLALTTVEATRLILFPPDYFPRSPSLFPLWPEWNPEMALRMAGVTMFLLFMPKLLAAIDVLLKKGARRYGGIWPLFTSVFREILLSALLAPIRMLAHTRFVLEALFNIRLRWAGQNRTEETGWRDAARTHFPGSAVGASWAVFAWWLKPMFFYWSLPIALPLVLAAPTSAWTSRVSLGDRLRRRRRFLIPEETARLDLLEDLESYQGVQENRYEGRAALFRALLEPRANGVHRALARHGARSGVLKERLVEPCSRLLRKGPSALNVKELTAILSDRDALSWLHREIWCATQDTYWGRMLHWRRRPGLDRQTDGGSRS